VKAEPLSAHGASTEALPPRDESPNHDEAGTMGSDDDDDLDAEPSFSAPG
jgi:hypothetical protein